MLGRNYDVNLLIHDRARASVGGRPPPLLGECFPQDRYLVQHPFVIACGRQGRGLLVPPLGTDDAKRARGA